VQRDEREWRNDIETAMFDRTFDGPCKFLKPLVRDTTQ
jgi:hypothetical protein